MAEGIRVDEELTRRMAHLARLELSDEEVRTFAHQLGDILKYVEQLQAADTAGVEPLLTPVELETALREDAVRPSPKDAEGQPRVLRSAPESFQGGFKVPPII